MSACHISAIIAILAIWSNFILRLQLALHLRLFEAKGDMNKLFMSATSDRSISLDVIDVVKNSVHSMTREPRLFLNFQNENNCMHIFKVHRRY